MNGPHGYLKDCLPSGKSESEVRQQRTLSMVDVIGKAALPRGMSDEDLAWERGAQGRFFRALREMNSAVSQVNNDSSTIKINVTAWEDFIHDELPTEKHWEEKISEARNP